MFWGSRKDDRHSVHTYNGTLNPLRLQKKSQNKNKKAHALYTH